MKKVLTPVLCVLLMACTTTKPKQESVSDYNVIYQSIEQELPFKLNAMGLMIVFVHNQMNPKSGNKDYKKINTTAKEYALCMQTAIDNKFYQNELSEAVTTYLSEVDKESLYKDMQVLTDKDFVATTILLKDVFKLYSSNQSIANKRLAYQELENKTASHFRSFYERYDSEDNGGIFSSSYDKYFGQDSKFALFNAEQIEKCYAYQLGS